MKDLIAYIVSRLVDHPDDMRIEENDNGEEVTFELYVNPEDLSKVIGRGGRVAREIRILLKTLAAQDNRKATLEIKE